MRLTGFTTRFWSLLAGSRKIKNERDMKKILMTLALIAALTVGVKAQDGGGLFQRGQEPEKTEKSVFENRGGGFPGLPPHGEEGDQPAPIGGGVLLLCGMAAAYAATKKSKK